MTRLTRKSYMGFSPTFTRERSIFAAEKNIFSIIRSQELPRNRRVKRSVDCVHYISILECVFVLNGKATERKSHWKNRPSSLKNASRTPGRLALPVRTWLPFHLLNAQERANNPPLPFTAFFLNFLSLALVPLSCLLLTLPFPVSDHNPLTLSAQCLSMPSLYNKAPLCLHPDPFTPASIPNSSFLFFFAIISIDDAFTALCDVCHLPRLHSLYGNSSSPSSAWQPIVSFSELQQSHSLRLWHYSDSQGNQLQGPTCRLTSTGATKA